MLGMVDKMDIFYEENMPKVGGLCRSSFLSEGLKLPEKLDLQRPPLAKMLPCW